MSAMPDSFFSTLQFQALQPMREADLPEVMEIEIAIYPFPWTTGNFLDSLNSGYTARIMRDGMNKIAGYFLLMPVVDEAHLLSISVRRDLQGQGLGRYLLQQICAAARLAGTQSILLEVRPSNSRALAVYQAFGFVTIGRRKAYYPAAQGQREDAIVMRFAL